jgi:4-amino-4-deoxy-L-arabinose transferase-like glycosyltransferase
VLDPDEPRYLAIGRAMAQTRDFITPRLWGSPWFEKPPLLYWMASVGALVNLGPELSGRLPVAILSLLFLAAMFALLRREFGMSGPAAAVLLSTSLGWIAYSNLALTDLPLAVFFCLAVFLALPLVDLRVEIAEGRWRWVAIGASLGLAVLAKGMVPLVLAFPGIWYLRRWWRRWIFTILAALIVALPWYLLMYLRNGHAFLEEFFWKQHFERLYSSSLLHVQPWWYYLPVFLGALYPWTPLLGFVFAPLGRWDRRSRFLGATVLFGLIFFSVSLNKLPGYLLPLMPLTFALIGSLAQQRFPWQRRTWLVTCAVLIALLPLSAIVLQESLQAGRITLRGSPHLGPTVLFYMVAPIVAVILARRDWAGILLVLCLVASGFYLKIVSFPVLERSVSPRSLWERVRNAPGSVCNDWIDRNWAYGLALYRGTPYPLCTDGGHYDFALRSRGRRMPSLVPLTKP